MATLKELRKSRGISQVELAVHLGVSPSSIYKLEAGKQTPKLPLVRRICAYFNVSPEALEFGRFSATAPVESPPPRARLAATSATHAAPVKHHGARS